MTAGSLVASLTCAIVLAGTSAILGPTIAQAAEVSWEAAAEDEEQLSQWHLEQAYKYLAEDLPTQALAHAERALELVPTSRTAKEVVTQARRAFHAKKEHLDKKANMIGQARRAEQQGHDQKALTLWTRVQELDPHDQTVQESRRTVQRRIDGPAGPVTHSALGMRDLVPERPLLSEYLISHGDAVEVFVWQQPDLTRQAIVRPDGRISFPLVGDVDAVGLTLTKLDEILTERLKTYLRFPDVSLAIRRFGGTKTIVLGQVVRPGVYVPAGKGRVLEVIAMAGGFKKDARRNQVMLIRGGLAEPQVAKLNLKDILKGGGANENVVLQPDDIIFVPKGRMASAVDWMTQLSPALSEVLVGQSVATNFGARETAPGITR